VVLKKKSEGIKALTPDPISIQDMTMLDWYAMSATIGLIYEDDDPEAAAMKIFDLAEALMAEREKRL
jgi:hypothetical protein